MSRACNNNFTLIWGIKFSIKTNSMRPNLSNINFNSSGNSSNENPQPKPWKTAEGILVKNYFQKEDLADAEHLDFAAGLPPYLRGPYSTMYVQQPWTIRDRKSVV